MSDEWKEWSNHILTELKRFDHNHERIFDKLEEQGETLVRNTVTLEEHVRRTDLLEEDIGQVKEKIGDVESDVDKIKGVFGLFKPTKQKLKWLVLISSLLGSMYGGVELSDEATRNKTFEAIERLLK